MFITMSEPVGIHGNGSRYVGKRLLVGITFATGGGDFVRHEQFHGRIFEAGEGRIVVELANTGKRISLPLQLQKAERGEYRVRLTGEVVIGPDHFANWAWKTSSRNADREYGSGIEVWSRPPNERSALALKFACEDTRHVVSDVVNSRGHWFSTGGAGFSLGGGALDGRVGSCSPWSFHSGFQRS